MPKAGILRGDCCTSRNGGVYTSTNNIPHCRIPSVFVVVGVGKPGRGVLATNEELGEYVFSLPQLMTCHKKEVNEPYP